MEERRDPNSPSPKRILFSSSLKNIWINILLFGATVISTFVVGFSWGISYKYAHLISQNPQLSLGAEVFKDPQIIQLSLIYSLVLLGILLGHELGHFLTCRHYQINATLPYFIPAPTLIGTLGAFIKIKSPITRKKELFDVGVAGPLTGFILSLPALTYGLNLSKKVYSLPEEGSIVFGEPLILRVLEEFILKGNPGKMDIVLHPVAFAGWVGIFVTALNLFPIGQLDGGHVAYALLGSKIRKIAPVLLVAFIFLGIFFWIGWFIWAVLIYFLGLKHPQIVDDHISLSPTRKLLGIVVLVIFVFSFIPAPVKGYNLFEVLNQFGV